MISMFSIGMMVGGIAKNAKVAGIIASVLYFPMLIFSGATLPYEVMPAAMQIAAMAAIAAICSFVAIRFFKWE